MKGPPPQPTALRLIRGNPGKRPLPKREPKPTLGTTAPKWLSPYAKTEWVRVYKEAANLGMITKLDRASLAAYCEALADFRKATEEAAKSLPLVKLTTGNYQENPLYRQKRQAMAGVIKAAAELGFTPSARTRVQAIEQREDPAEKAAKEKFGF